MQSKDVVDNCERLRLRGPKTRLLTAAVLGNICEFFDFTSYAFFAVMIGRAFFPSESPHGSLLLSLAVFGVGFVTRPLGSVLIGRYADKAGRRPALLLTIILMAAGTLMIAITPTYETIGVVAPLVIITARLLQGAALGGEFGPATVYLFEVATEGKRGLWTSWQPASQGLATVLAGTLGVVLARSLSNQQLMDWGWRVPFFLGLAIVPIGLYLRHNLPETLVRSEGENQALTGDAGSLRLGSKLQVSIFAQIGFGTIAIYLSSYLATFSMQSLGLPPTVAFYSAIAAGGSVFVGCLLGGWASDNVSPHLVIAIPRWVIIFTAIPMFSVVAESRDLLALMCLSIALPFLAMVSGGASFAAMIEALPPDRRSVGIGTPYALVVALLGGTAQFVVTTLVVMTRDNSAPAYYLIAICVLSLVTLPWLKGRGAG